jgi:Bacterial archaeo-eukaryotic release factor family 10
MNDLELRKMLQELSALHSEAEPVVTLYLDTHWSDEKQRERSRIYVREAAKAELDRHDAHPQREALERTLRRIVAEGGDRATQQGERNGRGLAIFACEALNLWRVVDLPVSVGSKLCTGMRPQLLPLARLLDDVEPALVAVVHLTGARVYEVALGGVVAEATIEGPLPRSYQSGGYMPRPGLGRQQVPGNERGTAEGFQYERSQKNQRHYEKIAERNRNAAAEFLAQRFDQHPAHVVLVGPRAVVAAFERALPHRVQERVLARIPEPPGAQAATSPGAQEASGPAAARAPIAGPLVQEVLKCLAAKERESENEAIEQALGQAKRGGLAVLGPDDVVLAVNERRVHRLILEDDFERSGWLCRNCNAIGVNHTDKCTYCSGDLAWVKEIGEELASRVMADDGDVEIVPHDRRLHSYHGVAAMLRQASGGFGSDEKRAPRA